jgi:hypothetical protein
MDRMHPWASEAGAKAQEDKNASTLLKVQQVHLSVMIMTVQTAPLLQGEIKNL